MPPHKPSLLIWAVAACFLASCGTSSYIDTAEMTYAKIRQESQAQDSGGGAGDQDAGDGDNDAGKKDGTGGDGSPTPTKNGEETTRPKTPVESHQPVDGLAVSRNGLLLATYSAPDAEAAAGRIKLWDLRTGKEVGGYEPENAPAQLALSPDGSFLALVHPDLEAVHVVAANSGQSVRRLTGGPYTVAAFTHDGTSVVAPYGDQGVHVVGVTTGQRLDFKSPTVESTLPVAPSPAAAVVAVGLSTVRGQKLVNQVQFVGLPELDVVGSFDVAAPVTALAWSLDGKTLAVATQRGGVVLWDTITEQAGVALSRDSDDAFRHYGRLALRHDGKLLAACPVSGKLPVDLWDVSAVKRRTLGTAPSRDVAFLPSGTLIVAAEGAPLRFLDPATGEDGKPPF